MKNFVLVFMMLLLGTVLMAKEKPEKSVFETERSYLVKQDISTVALNVVTLDLQTFAVSYSSDIYFAGKTVSTDLKAVKFAAVVIINPVNRKISNHTVIQYKEQPINRQTHQVRLQRLNC